MASGFPSGGGGGGGGAGDFYNSTGFSNNSGMMSNNAQLQYRQQQLQQLQQLHHLQQDQFSSIPLPRRNMPNFGVKRPISDLHPQQQPGFFMRSMKPRNQYNHTSPISPLTPFDFSSSSSHPQLNLQQQLRSLPITNSNNTNLYNPSLFMSNRVQQPPVERESESMKNQLQELEKQLLGDDAVDEESLSGVTNEWTENLNLPTPTPTPTPSTDTAPNLQSQAQAQAQAQAQTQNPFSPSPSSSSTSSSASSSSPSNAISSKQSFIDIATSISEGNIDVATVKLDHLQQISNPRGDCEQRLISYMASALRSRVNSVENPPPVMELFNQEQTMATQMLFEASPCFKLGFMASNLAILEATRDLPSDIHVLDFDIGQGSQYVSLIHAIAERQQQSKVAIRITSVVLDSVVSESDARIVGDPLKKLADRLGVGFKFNAMCKKITELTHESLSCELNEALVVNFAFKLQKLSDESVSTENPRDELLRRVKDLNPRAVTLVEQEMNCNTAPFVARVGEVSSYYLALFNSLDSTMNRDGLERVKIEECLGRKAANSVACEGRERVERCEVFGKWRARMRMAGFASRPLGGHVAESMRAKLNLAYKNIPNPGFTVREEADGVFFGWNDRMLTVASSWC